jgi:hypothetical protein
VIFKLDRSLFALISALTVVACRGEDPGTSDTDASTGGSTSSESASSTGAPTTTTGTPTTTDPGTTTTTTDPTMAGTTDPCADSGGFIDCNSSSGGGGLGEIGDACDGDADCVSMNCYKNMVLMVAICAECNEDADCVAAGTGTACNINVGTQSIVCSDGSNGATCMSDEACQSGHCDAVIEVPIPGVLPDTCGECSSSADCDMGMICSPTFDIMAFSGQKKCIAPGSVPNNALCPSDEAEGDMACMSGHCTNTTLMGFVPVDICGECTGDGDCDMGKTCMAATASLESGLAGSTCV